jgi:hypothetical protein
MTSIINLVHVSALGCPPQRVSISPHNLILSLYILHILELLQLNHSNEGDAYLQVD